MGAGNAGSGGGSTNNKQVKLKKINKEIWKFDKSIQTQMIYQNKKILLKQ
jgi:hypothetical protein